MVDQFRKESNTMTRSPQVRIIIKNAKFLLFLHFATSNRKLLQTLFFARYKFNMYFGISLAVSFNLSLVDGHCENHENLLIVITQV